MSVRRAPAGRRSLLLAFAALALGCAAATRSGDVPLLTADDLRAGTALGVGGQEPPPDDGDILAVSPGMQAFLDAHVSRSADRATRLRDLARTIVDPQRFGLLYDETTRTAAQTFETRRGNCLSFSNMFVALARRAGLDVQYQEVDTPPDWSLRDDTFVLNRHVNVVVDLGRDGEHVVDFNMDDFRTSYDRRAISDARALAHFFNNLGVERMQAGEAALALAYFRRATGHDPLFSPAWTNLGLLYWRQGHAAHAEAAYLQALKADSWDLVATSNLASLYEQRGERVRASRHRARVTAHRERNPYYRYQLAQQAFRERDYDGAIGHLRYAVGRKKNEDRFFFLLGLCHLRKGDEARARAFLARAEQVAATDAMKRRYADKLDILLSPR